MTVIECPRCGLIITAPRRAAAQRTYLRHLADAHELPEPARKAKTRVRASR